MLSLTKKKVTRPTNYKMQHRLGMVLSGLYLLINQKYMVKC